MQPKKLNLLMSQDGGETFEKIAEISPVEFEDISVENTGKQRTITKAYTRNDIDPVLQINVGDIAIEEEDGWWKITDPEGNKKGRIAKKLVDELTVVEEQYVPTANAFRVGNKMLFYDDPAEVRGGYIMALDENKNVTDARPIPITPDLLTNITLTYPVKQDNGELKDETFRFKENKLTLPRYNELEYEPESKMWMLNGIFLPESPKYLHQLQNCIFGLTFIDVKVEA